MQTTVRPSFSPNAKDNRAASVNVATMNRILRRFGSSVCYAAIEDRTMVTREAESKIREVVRPHIDAACQEIAETEIVNCWWPDGFAERLSELMVQSIALMAESCEVAEREAV